jgi:hypothetical protein
MRFVFFCAFFPIPKPWPTKDGNTRWTRLAWSDAGRRGLMETQRSRLAHRGIRCRICSAVVDLGCAGRGLTWASSPASSSSATQPPWHHGSTVSIMCAAALVRDLRGEIFDLYLFFRYVMLCLWSSWRIQDPNLRSCFLFHSCVWNGRRWDY